jgi:hypothetical protein
VRVQVMQSLLLYMYTGEADVPTADLHDFLRIAKYFRVFGKSKFL